jgi:hypothetical protein
MREERGWVTGEEELNRRGTGEEKGRGWDEMRYMHSSCMCVAKTFSRLCVGESQTISPITTLYISLSDSH